MHTSDNRSPKFDIALLAVLPFMLPVLPVVALMHLVAALEGLSKGANETAVILPGDTSARLQKSLPKKSRLNVHALQITTANS